MEPIPVARELLYLLREDSVPLITQRADDLLLFLTRLCDEFEIRQSRSPRFPGNALTALRGLMEGLESDPEALLGSSEQREALRVILEDIVSGRILLRRKSL